MSFMSLGGRSAKRMRGREKEVERWGGYPCSQEGQRPNGTREREGIHPHATQNSSATKSLSLSSSSHRSLTLKGRWGGEGKKERGRDRKSDTLTDFKGIGRERVNTYTHAYIQKMKEREHTHAGVERSEKHFDISKDLLRLQNCHTL